MGGIKLNLLFFIAWGFGGFLESVAGFGTAVAIPAATNLIGSEGKILNSVLKVCLLYIVLAGVIVFFCGSIFTL